MKAGLAFPPKYLTPADIGDGVLTIDEIKLEPVGTEDDREEQLVAYFKETSRGLILSRANARIIGEIAGTDETNDWPDHVLVLYVNTFIGGEISVAEERPRRTNGRGTGEGARPLLTEPEQCAAYPRSPLK